MRIKLRRNDRTLFALTFSGPALEIHVESDSEDEHVVTGCKVAEPGSDVLEIRRHREPGSELELVVHFNARPVAGAKSCPSDRPKAVTHSGVVPANSEGISAIATGASVTANTGAKKKVKRGRVSVTNGCPSKQTPAARRLLWQRAPSLAWVNSKVLIEPVVNCVCITNRWLSRGRDLSGEANGGRLAKQQVDLVNVLPKPANMMFAGLIAEASIDSDLHKMCLRKLASSQHRGAIRPKMRPS